MYFCFSLKNIFWRSKFDNIFCKWYQLTKNKNLEIELLKDSYLFRFEVSFYPHGRDHGGLQIGLSLFNYELSINFYDSRHWDYENDCWLER